MSDYAGDEYQNAVKASVGQCSASCNPCFSDSADVALCSERPAAMLEGRIAADPPSEVRLAELVKIWEDCTRLEVGFWDGSMDLRFEDL